MSIQRVSENEVFFTVRAKYIPTSDGLRLAKVQRFSVPKFRSEGFEEIKNNGFELSELDRKKASVITLDEGVITDDMSEDIIVKSSGIKGDYNDVMRAIKRAQINAFDVILSNPALDTFVTLTYSPDVVSDKADYDECYNKLKNWLSNRVQRKGLKYVGVPERTKAGDIHFHIICNKDALNLVRARSPAGRALTHNGKALYNVDDWTAGFSSAEIIGGSEGERDAVAKYIFKYMRKQFGQKIGGRYCLIGGDIKKPVFVLGNTPEEFFDGNVCKYDNHIDLDCGISYDEWSFI